MNDFGHGHESGVEARKTAKEQSTGGADWLSSPVREMEAYRDCPQFEECSVNRCPLDPLVRETLPGDPEMKCKTQLKTRRRIAERYGLSTWLTDSEAKRERRRQVAREKWERLSPEERGRRLTPFKRKSDTFSRGSEPNSSGDGRDYL